MAFGTAAVANYLLDLGDADGKPLSPMKLQKMLYFAHGWYLALTGKPLLDEQIEAWRWGPVIRSIYHEFKEFGSEPISDSRIKELRMVRTLDGNRKLKLAKKKLDLCEGDVQEAKAVIDRVWKVYKDYTAIQLSNMTHEPGTPWHETWEAMGPSKRKGTDIPDDKIAAYFKSQFRSKA